MGEELQSLGFQKNGIYIAEYEYYPLQRTSLNQYKKAKVIPSKNYGKYGKRQPDGLVVERTNSKDLRVIGVIEYKQPKEFQSEAQKKDAVEQCNDLCQELNSVFGIISDGENYIWINPKMENSENNYIDRTTGKERSYSIIKNEDKKFLKEPFILQKKSEKDKEKLELETENTLFYIKRIISSISKTNSILKSIEEVNPIKLATSVWQDIYVNTGKSPTKCLYNVVELFIFKFLSDLEVLKSPYNFDFVLELSKSNNAKEALNYYANNCRKRIKNELFPAGKDGTTILNGTIFVDSKENAIESQASLFKNSLEKYSKFGSLNNIQKDFKTKLFETFLKQSSDKSRLGQFFTPRKVVRAIIEMADVEKLKPGTRVCDPFCGVGGFITEIFQDPNRKRDFLPNAKGEIKPKITYIGFDKGNDEDDERVIILAKANMLIYLSEIVERYPTFAPKFSEVINETFHFLSDSNLGTLKIENSEDEKYDLVITNPPYITSGTTSLKKEIENEGLSSKYTANGKGVDGLCLEWIIRNLKKEGKAFIVLPHGIFNSTQNKTLREFLLKHCFVHGIISLPIKTFFNTPQKTFILIIERKENIDLTQDFPVFTYLVSDIGETLNIYRFETEGKSDLEKAKELYNLYKGAPKSFPADLIGDKRCKIQPLSKFEPGSNWDIDKFWTKEEKIELGIEEEENIVTIDEFRDKIEDLMVKLGEYSEFITSLKDEI
ncbi:HsdM family class I SAM-dependent methyltransferase [Mongoliibacter ruber]|uniref:site-specific DNA-methyltransferase (adenine-specific) n=1 Tax=Mongoliibacter ruber TaxID=1750599 RepID=A0A2T0W9G2_9BACT|nr:N-6 DNA methylase [Mongoliibacter ruber]PRY83337.1 type I restriction-modification system DNA methylase subunit [Mongoliibacter ruber]